MDYKKYFDFIVFYKDNVVKFKCKLKDSILNSKKGAPFRPGGKTPYSSMELQYFMYYIDDIEIAKSLYNFRKSLSSKHNMADWFISNVDLSDYDIEKINEWKSSFSKKIKKSLNNHYSSDKALETKKKYKLRSEKHSKRIGEMNKKKWEDKEWVDKIMSDRYENGVYERVSESHTIKHKTDDKFREEFLSRVKDPKRIDKIRKASIKMWKDAKEHDREKFRRMLLSQKNKNFEINGFKMNQIEYTIASVLNELEVNWEYEKVFHIESNTYVPDFYLPDYDIIIECYGDFWHANPRYMKSNDTTHKYVMASSVWERDERRIKELLTKVSNVLILWETDILDDSQKCKQQIIEMIYG